jgi:hypothetical protein
MEHTAESLIEPSSSITCSITLTKDRLMTNSMICKHVYKEKKSLRHCKQFVLSFFSIQLKVNISLNENLNCGSVCYGGCGWFGFSKQHLLITTKMLLFPLLIFYNLYKIVKKNGVLFKILNHSHDTILHNSGCAAQIEVANFFKPWFNIRNYSNV